MSTVLEPATGQVWVSKFRHGCRRFQLGAWQDNNCGWDTVDEMAVPGNWSPQELADMCQPYWLQVGVWLRHRGRSAQVAAVGTHDDGKLWLRLQEKHWGELIPVYLLLDEVLNLPDLEGCYHVDLQPV